MHKHRLTNDELYLLLVLFKNIFSFITHKMKPYQYPDRIQDITINQNGNYSDIFISKIYSFAGKLEISRGLHIMTPRNWTHAIGEKVRV